MCTSSSRWVQAAGRPLGVLTLLHSGPGACWPSASLRHLPLQHPTWLLPSLLPFDNLPLTPAPPHPNSTPPYSTPRLQLMPETLYLTVNLIDRFLEAKQVTRKHLQLVGVTAMLVASKYEEIWAPEVRDFVYISDRAYTRDQILNMEKIMLNSLRFNLTIPSIYNFLGRNFKAAGIVGDR